MANYQKLNVTGTERVELHDRIGLTGAEISVNVLPAGASVPFVHSHKQNEEIYIILYLRNCNSRPAGRHHHRRLYGRNQKSFRQRK